MRCSSLRKRLSPPRLVCATSTRTRTPRCTAAASAFSISSRSILKIAMSTRLAGALDRLDDGCQTGLGLDDQIHSSSSSFSRGRDFFSSFHSICVFSSFGASAASAAESSSVLTERARVHQIDELVVGSRAQLEHSLGPLQDAFHGRTSARRSFAELHREQEGANVRFEAFDDPQRERSGTLCRPRRCRTDRRRRPGRPRASTA